MNTKFKPLLVAMSVAGMYFNYERRPVRIYKPRCKVGEGITRMSIREFADRCDNRTQNTPQIVTAWDMARDDE